MRRGNSASWNNDQATTKTAMIETKQNPVSILLQWIQGFVLVVAERRNVFYLRFFFITYAVLIIVNEPIKHILQLFILGHNAHNAVGRIP